MGMESKTLTKDTLISVLDDLPEEKVREILDFAEFLLIKSQNKKPIRTLDPNEDPILKIIGLASEKPFADETDEELYNE